MTEKNLTLPTALSRANLPDVMKGRESAEKFCRDQERQTCCQKFSPDGIADLKRSDTKTNEAKRQKDEAKILHPDFSARLGRKSIPDKYHPGTYEMIPRRLIKGSFCFGLCRQEFVEPVPDGGKNA